MAAADCSFLSGTDDETASPDSECTIKSQQNWAVHGGVTAIRLIFRMVVVRQVGLIIACWSWTTHERDLMAQR